MLRHALAIADTALAAATPEAASRRFHAAAAASGATYLQTRVYRRPAERLTPASHWRAGGVVVRMCAADWPDSDAFRYICIDRNPLVDAVRQGLTTYRFGDFATRTPAFGRYWDALAEGRIGDALCATAYGPGRRIASLHLGFGDAAPDAEAARAWQMAGLLLVERLLALSPDPDPPADTGLTLRERDALCFVADGKTDWEIAQILGIAEATARFHVDNARRKLGASNRAQAVARLIAREGPL